MIDKRIPVAGGMAGGSADAAATLRLARRASGLGDDALLHALAFGLGADVPSQVRPRRLLGTGAGERLEPLPPAAPSPTACSSCRATRSSPPRTSSARPTGSAVAREPDALAAARDAVRAGRIPPRQRPRGRRRARCCPSVGDALAAVRDAGAEHAMVSGSGPTVVGLFPTPAAAAHAAERLAARGRPGPAPIVTAPLSG